MADQTLCVWVDAFSCDPTRKEWESMYEIYRKTKSFHPAWILSGTRSALKTSSNFHWPTGSSKSVENSTKLGALLEAKAAVDSNRIKDIVVVMDPREKSWWEKINEILFTPYYNIDFQQTSVSGKNGREEMSCLVTQLGDLLRKLPALGEVQVLQSALMSHIFVHGFSTRYGGISSYPGTKSLSLVYSTRKPDPEIAVKENRKRLADAVGFNVEKFHLAEANHGVTVWTVGEEKPSGYDAIVSNIPGVVVAAPGADCTLVLFADPIKKCCGAVHAGWRGTTTAEGVSIATVRTMMEKFGTDPKNLLVAIGPSIGKCCYEFGEKEAKLFSEIDPRCVDWKAGCPKPFVDVALANQIQLERGGVLPENIDMTHALCTKCHSDMFYSFRRDGQPFGNQAGFIGIK